MPPAGHIAADRTERAHKLARRQAGSDSRSTISASAAGKSANLLCGCAQRIAQSRIERLPRRGHLFRRHAQRRRAAQPVEFRRVAEQRAIAALAHVGHNALHRGQHSVQRRAAAPFQRRQRLPPRPARFVLWSGSASSFPNPCSHFSRQCRNSSCSPTTVPHLSFCAPKAQWTTFFLSSSSTSKGCRSFSRRSRISY
jgi:hypothetical protein